MEFQFERGKPDRPRGHALVYFKDAASGRLLETYVVVLPVPMDIAKYLPPFLAPHVGQATPQELAAFALPPVPEDVSSHEELVRLAELRDDDLVLGGTLRADDIPEQMQMVNELVQRYAQSCQEAARRAPPPAEPAQPEKGVVGVNEVLYSLMSEHDKLSEMSKLVARLRFAAEGRDEPGTKEVIEEIGVLAKYLPETYDVPELVRSASEPSGAARELEERIKSLQGR
jgi:hypothetical protein